MAARASAQISVAAFARVFKVRHGSFSDDLILWF
jgi:hypothetical protein